MVSTVLSLGHHTPDLGLICMLCACLCQGLALTLDRQMTSSFPVTHNKLFPSKTVLWGPRGENFSPGILRGRHGNHSDAMGKTGFGMENTHSGASLETTPLTSQESSPLLVASDYDCHFYFPDT